MIFNNYRIITKLIFANVNKSKDEIIVLQSLQTEYERIMNLKRDLEKQLEERANELKTTKTVANSFTNQLKEKLEQITEAKVCAESYERECPI